VEYGNIFISDTGAFGGGVTQISDYPTRNNRQAEDGIEVALFALDAFQCLHDKSMSLISDDALALADGLLSQEAGSYLERPSAKANASSEISDMLLSWRHWKASRANISQ
jgi:hypothetical protein